MAEALTARRGETEAHARLKRQTMIWAQARGYSACALEVQLPGCHFRADVAAFGEQRDGERAAVFECKQALPDLRRDNCESAPARERLRAIERRREIIERNLRVHYPTLRTGESLFPEYDAFDFGRLDHRGYARVARDGDALRYRLADATKFEKLARYQCANLFYLVITAPLREIEFELPRGWGLLVETANTLELAQKPAWHAVIAQNKMRFLRRVAAAATRAQNRELAITANEIELARRGVV